MSRMKKNIIVSAFIACMVFSILCFYKLSKRDIMDKGEAYGSYLEQVTEKNFMGEDEIKSADAKVSYVTAMDQYSIELLLSTEQHISEERIELYKKILNETYDEVILKINGEIK